MSDRYNEPTTPTPLTHTEAQWTHNTPMRSCLGEGVCQICGRSIAPQTDVWMYGDCPGGDCLALANDDEYERAFCEPFGAPE